MSVQPGMTVAKKFLDLQKAGKLASAVNKARLQLRQLRENRRDMAIEVAGDRYSEYTLRMKKPVNLMSMYQTTMARSLVPKTPRYMLSAKKEQYRPVVSAMQLWMNAECERMKLGDTFQRIVIDALYQVGIAKIALATPCDVAMKAWNQKAGRPILSRIDFDDFVFSTDAHDFSECDFIGHRFRCPLEVAKDIYKKKAKELVATEQYDTNQEGDERIGKIIRGDYGTSEFEEHCELWEIYLPRHRMVVVLSDTQIGYATDQSETSALWEQQWIGPESGPYEFLGYQTVPGSALPKGPMMDLYHLDQDCNNAFRKANNMIRRLKEFTTFRKGADQDAHVIKTGRDGDLIALDDPKSVANIVTGGQAVQVVMAIAEGYRKLFSAMAGNLELLNGTAPQSRTARQDQMLNENAGMSVVDLQEKTIRFISECGERLAWFHHNDPVSVQEVSQSLPGMPDVQIHRKVFPWGHNDPNSLRREHRFEDMDVRVDPYSVRYQTPQQRSQMLDRTIMEIIGPLMPLLMQQGYQPDMGEYLRMKGELSDFSDLERLMGMGEPMLQDGPTGQAHDRTMPMSTTREYIRRSQSGPPSDNNMQAQMLGVDMGGAAQGGVPGLIGG